MSKKERIQKKMLQIFLYSKLYDQSNTLDMLQIPGFRYPT